MTTLPPAAFWVGLEQFNRGEFYACHDTLEAIWMEASEPPKSLYQGILQIAVGLYHLSNLNWRGAVILLGEGTTRISAYDPTYAGVDIAQLLDQGLDLLSALQQLGPDRVEAAAQHLGLRTLAPGATLPPLEELAIDLALPVIHWQPT